MAHHQDQIPFFEVEYTPEGDLIASRELPTSEVLWGVLETGVQHTLRLLEVVQVLPLLPRDQLTTQQLDFIATDAAVCTSLLAMPLGLFPTPYIVDVRATDETNIVPDIEAAQVQ